MEILMAVLLFLLVFFAVVSVMFRQLLKASIALAVTSAILSIAMFILGTWMAAVIELSVCAGLITVIFISTISLSKPLTDQEDVVEAHSRMKRFFFLPFVLIIVFGIIYFLWTKGMIYFNFASLADTSVQSLRETIWGKRQLDILGQIIIILAGVFGVVVLFKEREVK